MTLQPNKLTLSNPENSILEIFTTKKEVHFYRDPWGRDSSGTPDEIYTFDKLASEKKNLLLLKTNLNEIDWKAFEEMVFEGNAKSDN